MSEELQAIVSALGFGESGGKRRALYAVLDAARDPRVLADLEEIGLERHCLFDGERARTLAPYAPYLVVVDDASKLEALLTASWGRARGIFVSSSAPLREAKRRLSQMLEVTTDDDRKLHFRFYDPRVARVFFSSLTPRQAGSVFEAIDAYFMEGQDEGTLVRFELVASKVVQARIRVARD